MKAPDRPSATSRRSRLPGLTTQIFIGLLVGIAIGAAWPAVGVGIKPLADIFLRMIKMIIAPLLFATLTIGIAGTSDLKTMGRIGAKAIVYFEVATTIALFLGLALVNLFKPGVGLAIPIGPGTAVAAMAQAEQSGWDIVLHVFPTSVIDAMALGIPPVVFGVGGLVEVIQSGSGYVVPPGDIAAFAEKVTLLARDEALRARVGAAARERAKHFGSERMTKETEAVYQSVLNG